MESRVGQNEFLDEHVSYACTHITYSTKRVHMVNIYGVKLLWDCVTCKCNIIC